MINNLGREEMHNNLTPCQQLGYREGDLFIDIKSATFKDGAILILEEDDGTDSLLFGAKTGTCYDCSYLYKIGAYTNISNVSKLSDYFEDIFKVSETEISLFALAFGLSIEEAKTKVEEAIELKTIWNEHKGILK